MVAFKRPDRIVSTEDLRYVVFDQGKAFLSKSWALATNPRRILDVAMVSTRVGDGALVLYEASSGPTKLQTKFFTGNLEGMACEPHCPQGKISAGYIFSGHTAYPSSGAVCLTSFLDPNSYQSVALVAGETVVAFPPDDYSSSQGKGQVIDTKDKIGAIKNIESSQVGEELRMWYTTDKDAVHYYNLFVV